MLETIGTILGSFGGGALVMGVFLKYFGNILADKISQSTMAKYNLELQVLKDENRRSLDELRKRWELEIKKREELKCIKKL